MKEFNFGHDTRPPEAFRISYDVEIKEKVEVPALPGPDGVSPDDGVTTYKMRGTGVWETRSIVFHAVYDSVPMGLLLAASENGPGQIEAIRETLECVVVEDEISEFLTLLRNKEARITPWKFQLVIEWLMELSSNRPTPASSG